MTQTRGPSLLRSQASSSAPVPCLVSADRRETCLSAEEVEAALEEGILDNVLNEKPRLLPGVDICLFDGGLKAGSTSGLSGSGDDNGVNTLLLSKLDEERSDGGRDRVRFRLELLRKPDLTLFEALVLVPDGVSVLSTSTGRADVLSRGRLLRTSLRCSGSGSVSVRVVRPLPGVEDFEEVVGRFPFAPKETRPLGVIRTAVALRTLARTGEVSEIGRRTLVGEFLFLPFPPYVYLMEPLALAGSPNDRPAPSRSDETGELSNCSAANLEAFLAAARRGTTLSTSDSSPSAI